MMLVNIPGQPADSSSLMRAVSKLERPPPPYASGMLMVMNPASKAFCMISHGNSWLWSYLAAFGRISFIANSRAISLSATCSSVRV